jgi:hypothetical protein
MVLLWAGLDNAFPDYVGKGEATRTVITPPSFNIDCRPIMVGLCRTRVPNPGGSPDKKSFPDPAMCCTPSLFLVKR